MTKALVLFSGGLDSRLAVKLLQEQGIEVEGAFFVLPFGGGCCNDEMCSFQFSQKQRFKLHIIDCTKGKLLDEYLDLVKNPKYGSGVGINPCIDCRIFLIEKARAIQKKIKADFIATGEVLGERPMSQNKRALELIDKVVGEVKRPLIEIGIRGRRRDKQMELAKKFKISYPSPGGGCILCEKEVAKKLKILLGKNLINEKTLALSKIGRHFYKQGWFVVGRNKEESMIIEKFKCLKSGKGKPAVYYEKDKKTALELQKIYSTGEENRSKFEEWKI